jgi:ATP-binding cassette, subfamily C (CFTR/MRP), member 1
MMNVSAALPCLPSADSVFGPVVDGCRDNFDFTIAFEQYFFSIVPSAILLLAAPVRLRILSGKSRRVGGNTLKFFKLVSRS